MAWELQRCLSLTSEDDARINYQESVDLSFKINITTLNEVRHFLAWFLPIVLSRCTRSTVTLLHILNFSVIRIIRVRVSLSHSTSFPKFSPLQPSFKAGGIVALMGPQTGLKGDTDGTEIDFVSKQNHI